MSGEEWAAEIANLNNGSMFPHFQAGGTTIIGEGEGEAASLILLAYMAAAEKRMSRKRGM